MKTISIRSLAFCGIALLAFSCSKEGGTNRNSKPRLFDITIIPAPMGQSDNLPQTRHGDPVAGSLDESRIESLTVFAFRADGSDALELYKRVDIDASNNSSDPMWDPTRSVIRLLLTPGPKQIVTIANWNGADLSTLTTVTALNAAVRYHTTLPANPPVMTGQMVRTLIGGEQGVVLNLIRQSARVELWPMLDKIMDVLKADIMIEGVQFMNLASETYIMPHGHNPSMNAWDEPGFTGTPFHVMESNKYYAQLYHDYFYIPEYFGNSPWECTYMVIKARYNGEETFYSIAINGEWWSSQPLPQQYAVERNHSYAYYVYFTGKGEPYPQLPTRASRGEESGIQYELVIR